MMAPKIPAISPKIPAKIPMIIPKPPAIKPIQMGKVHSTIRVRSRVAPFMGSLVLVAITKTVQEIAKALKLRLDGVMRDDPPDRCSKVLKNEHLE